MLAVLTLRLVSVYFYLYFVFTFDQQLWLFSTTHFFLMLCIVCQCSMQQIKCVLCFHIDCKSTSTYCDYLKHLRSFCEEIHSLL